MGAVESRSWFERGIFDLGIAAAHLQSGLWLAGAQHARQAALKLLQAALVHAGEPEPSPRIGDLVAAVKARHPAFRSQTSWPSLDALAAATAVTEGQAREAYAHVEAIRDAVAALLH